MPKKLKTSFRRVPLRNLDFRAPLDTLNSGGNLKTSLPRALSNFNKSSTESLLERTKNIPCVDYENVS